MKKIIGLAIWLFAACVFGQNVGVLWDAVPVAQQADTTIVVLHTQNPTLPLDSWETVATLPGDKTFVLLTVTPGVHYFVAIGYSKFWGVFGEASNVAQTPAIPGRLAAKTTTKKTDIKRLARLSQ